MESMDLFSSAAQNQEKTAGINSNRPLSVRMRPQNFDEFIGQNESVGKGHFLRLMIENDTIPSLILFGPPGTGKTTLAQMIATMTKSHFKQINAVSSGISDIRKIVDEAQEQRKFYNTRTIIFIDEIHRFNKSQQDILLPYVEDGRLILIGATTENPYFEINAPLLSRLRLIRLKALDEESIVEILERALNDRERGLGKHGYHVSRPVLKMVASYASGDSRAALNLLEQATALLEDNGTLTEKELKELAGEKILNYDKNGDYHYDVVSAFIKSMRGSDPDAALHYLARMINSGEKPSFISRRIIICAAEDVGLADPNALTVAVEAAKAAEFVGFPEAQIPLAEAVLYICLAPKSNSAVMGIMAASAEAGKRSDWSIPDYLRDAHYAGAAKLGHGNGYLYPHDFGGWVEQEYMPSELKGHVYYSPGKNGMESSLESRWNNFRRKNK